MAVMSSISVWMPVLILGAVTMAIFGGFKARAFLVCTALVLLVNDGIVTQILKDLVGRPRPFEELAGVRMVDLQQTTPALLGVLKPPVVKESRFSHTPPHGRSYPSGHIANNFAVAVLLTVFFPPWGVLYFLIALVVSYSRVYVGAHWPGDAIGSAAQGAAIAMLGIAACEWGWRKWAMVSRLPVHDNHPSLLPEPE